MPRTRSRSSSPSEAARVFILALLALFAVLVAGSANAQVDRAVLSGTVADQTEALIPGATVILTDVERGMVREEVTDGQGRFRFVNLTPGTYEMRTTLEGFQAAVHTNLVLTVGQEVVLRVVLSAGALSEEVVVTGEATLVEATKSSLSGVVNETTVKELPLNGRSFEQLATLQLGVTRAQFGTKDVNAGFGAKISIAGARPNQTRYLLDGADINPQNDNPGSVAGLLLGVEAVREFRVETSTYGAQYGKSAGGVISVVTKSGTNEFHGSLFEYHRNNNLDAKNYFDPGPLPEFERNQFGFSAGGRIIKDRTFFFTSFEGLRESLGLTSRPVVPSIDARNGYLPSAGPGSPLVFVGVAPVIRPYLDLYPVPNGRDFGDGTAELIEEFTRPTSQNYYMVRLDHRLSANDSLYGRYVIDDANIVDTYPTSLFEVHNTSRSQYFTVEETRIFSSSILNTFRFSLNKTFTDSLNFQINPISPALDLSPVYALGLSGNVSPGSGIASIGGNSSLPKVVDYTMMEFADDFTVTRGRHMFKAGFLAQRIHWDSESWSEGGGGLSFQNLTTFLQGRPRQFAAVLPGSDAIRNYRMTFVDAYVQDDLRLTDRITLNIGLRYGYASDPWEVNGKASNYPADPTATAPVVGNPLFKEDKLNFDPRLGFAWDIRGDSTMALRGGAGAFSQPITPYHWQTAAVRQSPFFFRAQTQNPPFTTPMDPYNALPPLETALGLTPERPDSINYSKRPYTIQYSLTYQWQLRSNLGLTVATVGARGRNLSHGVEMNYVPAEILPDGRKFYAAGKPRINTSLGRHIVTVTDGESWYNGMIVGLERRFKDGLQFQIAYTLAKSMDLHSSVFSAEFSGGSARSPLDPTDQWRDKALSDFDVRNNLSVSAVYELPFGSGKKFGTNWSGVSEVLLGGWQVNGIVSLADGAPRMVQNSFDRSRHLAGDTSGHDRPDLVPGANPNPINPGNPDQYFDPSSFRLQEAGFLGTLGRNPLTAPGVATVDLSMVKNLSLGGSKALQFKVEFFNLLNRANFGSPNGVVFTNATGIPSGSAGRITDTTTTARQIQLVARFQW